MNQELLTLVLVSLLAVLAPLIARGLGHWVRIPIVVFELVLGILVGPSLLGWAVPSDFVGVLSEFGLAMLFFVAGTEIDFTSLRGRTGRRSIWGWLLSLGIGLGVGFILMPHEGAMVIAVALASTALGTLLPILRDNDELRTPFGKAVGAIGAVGEFGPLIAISLFLGGRSLGVAAVVLALFALIAAGAIVAALRLPHGALHSFVNSSLHTSGQFAIRVVLLILTLLVAVSVVLDLDMLLGAFVAGMVWRLMMRDAAEPDREVVESKIEALAFGFLVPIFFIHTGLTFDLASLLAQPALLSLVPLAALALFVVRGLPSMLSTPEGSSTKDRWSIAFLGATGLPIIVAVTTIGVEDKLIPATTATILVAGGMLSVLLFPLIGMLLRGDSAKRVHPATVQSTT
ncbi:MAG TPA: cation:proton antiporter [Micropruina sp.]|nr:cation:proton antiporter [Micropruina sp.]